MENQLDLIAVNNKIQQITALLNKLQQEAENFPAIFRNSKRALASLKMMELNISDLVEFNLHE